MISDSGTNAANDFHLIAPPLLLERAARDEKKTTRKGQRLRKEGRANNGRPFSL